MSSLPHATPQLFCDSSLSLEARALMCIVITLAGVNRVTTVELAMSSAGIGQDKAARLLKELSRLGYLDEVVLPW